MPLAVLAIAFVLPAAKDCSQVVSAMDVTFEGSLMSAIVAPPYVAAVLLVLSVIVARVRGRPPSGALGFVAGALVTLSSGCAVAVSLFEKEITIVSALGGLLLGALGVFLYTGARRRGWSRAWALQGAYVVGTLPVAVMNLMMGEYYGAFVFLSAFVVLIVGRLVALMIAADAQAARMRRAPRRASVMGAA
jgi:hypothetical protein